MSRGGGERVRMQHLILNYTFISYESNLRECLRWIAGNISTTEFQNDTYDFFLTQHKYMYILCGHAHTHTHTPLRMYMHMYLNLHKQISEQECLEKHIHVPPEWFFERCHLYIRPFLEILLPTPVEFLEKSYFISEVWITLLSRSDTINIGTVHRIEIRSSALCVWHMALLHLLEALLYLLDTTYWQQVVTSCVVDICLMCGRLGQGSFICVAHLEIRHIGSMARLAALEWDTCCTRVRHLLHSSETLAALKLDTTCCTWVRHHSWICVRDMILSYIRQTLQHILQHSLQQPKCVRDMILSYIPSRWTLCLCASLSQALRHILQRSLQRSLQHTLYLCASLSNTATHTATLTATPPRQQPHNEFIVDMRGMTRAYMRHDSLVCVRQPKDKYKTTKRQRKVSAKTTKRQRKDNEKTTKRQRKDTY